MVLGYSPNYDWEQGIYAIIFVAIMSYYFREGLVTIFASDKDEEESYIPCSPILAVDTVEVTKKSKEPFGEDDWDEICRTAIESAKEGDHRARDWVMKNVVVSAGSASSASSASRDTKDSVALDPTPKSVVDEAVAFLRSMGHTKKDAVGRVNAAIKLKKYDNVEILIKDLYKKG